MRISRFFIAAPLFNDREREFNRAVRDVLSRHMRVYLPQEDCGLLPDLLRTGMAANAAEERIFQSDLSALDACEGVLAVLDGATIDEGVAFEIGYGFARGKVCVGLQTDIRRLLPTGNNLMIQRSLSKIFGSLEELGEWVRQG